MFHVKPRQAAHRRGVTLVELLTIGALFAILALITLPAIGLFESKVDVVNTTEEIRSVLRLAQNRTVASDDQSTYGVYFGATATSDRYILFQGADYATRDASSDVIYAVPGSVELHGINLSGGGEVVFDRISGTTDQPGDVSVRLVSATSTQETIYVEASGKISLVSSTAGSDASRIADSRHVHVDYTNRLIDTATEKLVLTFSAATQDIVIQDNMLGGQIFWEGDVVDDGETQHVKIHTHLLNDTTSWTRFSIHRDRRFNSKPLTIDIDDVSGPDPDPGTIITYDAAGQTATGTSIYVSTPVWQ